jgi:hypothetical protein
LRALLRWNRVSRIPLVGWFARTLHFILDLDDARRRERVVEAREALAREKHEVEHAQRHRLAIAELQELRAAVVAMAASIRHSQAAPQRQHGGSGEFRSSVREGHDLDVALRAGFKSGQASR